MDLKTIDDLEALKAAGIKEGEKREFKLIWPSVLNVEKTICAFGNTSGGIILIGVNYDNTGNQIVDFQGIEKARNLEEKAIDIGGNINPRIIPASWLIDIPSGKVVQVIEVFKSRMIPHMSSNYIYYQRVDKENVPIPESLVERLYLARQVQQREAGAFLKEKEYFRFAGEPHWLSICFCPLYLDPNLISHSRSNLDFLDSLRKIIDPQAVDVFFGSMPEGYKWEIPQSPKVGKAVYDYLVHVLNNGVLAFGMWVKYPEPYWEETENWFRKMISLYANLQTKFRYPGWTRISLLLTNMRNVKMRFPNDRDNRMYLISRPMVPGDLLITIDFEDNFISNDPNKVIESFYTKVKINYGLDDYIP
jgi:hypothetical protein